MSVGVVNGVLWALVVAVIASVWFQDMDLGLLLGAAMVVNLVCAAVAGASIPLILDKIGIDPALAGGAVDNRDRLYWVYGLFGIGHYLFDVIDLEFILKVDMLYAVTVRS